jgi:MFS transporter, SP family, general alpha glucoside:H+ symporter
LAFRGRIEEAKRSLARLASEEDANCIDRTATLMVLTVEHERELNAHTSFAACFKGTDLRRTLIVMGCYCMQVISGTTLRAYATYFFLQAGLNTKQSFNMSILTYCLSFVGTVVAVSQRIDKLIRLELTHSGSGSSCLTSGGEPFSFGVSASSWSPT